MFRLKKLGVVREAETQAEADRYAAIGYEVIGETDPAQDALAAALGEYTVPELKEMCAAKGIAFSDNASRKALIALLTAAGGTE